MDSTVPRTVRGGLRECRLRVNSPSIPLASSAREFHLGCMQSENPFVADFVKMMNSAAGTLAGVGREARDGARERVKEFMGDMDFVSREEFDAVKELAATSRGEVETLKARLDALEAKLNTPT